MSYATLMVHVDADGELSGRVRIAADLAERFNAHLIGVAGWGQMALFQSEEALSQSAPKQPHLQDIMKALDLKGQEFLAAVESSARRAEWRTAMDVPTEVVAREARAADLVIIGNARTSNNPFLALDPGSLLLKVGRPVLVVPNPVNNLMPRRIAIAWKDVREARRAVQDALPFLRQAESVVIVEVAEGDEITQCLHRVRDVAAYLSRHHVEIITERVRPDEVGATESLLQFIQDENIHLMVAGGYGHSRLGEWAFGGVTHGLLTRSPICCLLSH